MEKFKAFLRRKDIEISIKRYGIDALGAMAQGLFCSLLIGTIDVYKRQAYIFGYNRKNPQPDCKKIHQQQ